MDSSTEQWTNFPDPLFLFVENQKFWEISYFGQEKFIEVRVGRLTQNDLEDLETHEQKRQIEDMNEEQALNKGESLIREKLKKGYKKRQPIQTKQEFETEKTKSPQEFGDTLEFKRNPGSEKGLKRKNPEPLIREDQKKILKSQPLTQQEVFGVQNGRKAGFFSPPSLKSEESSSDIEEESFRQRKKVTVVVNPPNAKKDLSLKGEYMTYEKDKKLYFRQIHLLDRYIKVENGIVDNSRITDTEISAYKTPELALDRAQQMIEDQISNGFQRYSEKYTYNFRNSEVGIKEPDIIFFKNSPFKISSPQQPKKNSLNTMEIENSLDLFIPRTSLDVKNQKTMLNAPRRDFDVLSDSNARTSFDSDEESKNLRNNKNKKGSRSRSQGRSVSPLRDRKNSEKTDQTILGKPVEGCYANFLEPTLGVISKDQIKGWYLSEKLDGVRCFWDGRQLWEKKGKIIKFPEFFAEKFPKSPLDGQLWAGRGNYQKCVKVVHSKSCIPDEWNELCFVVWDAPELEIPFDSRYQILKTVFSEIESPYIQLKEQRVCRGKEDLINDLENVGEEGGDGVHLRDPNSLYEQQRSRTLLEFPSVVTDTAVVTKIDLEKGKNGKLRVKNAQGIEFEIPINPAAKKNAFKVGDTVTFTSKGKFQNGAPKTPTLVKN